MRAIRRILQVVAFVGTITVGVVAVSLIVSQTPWFRDWLRRYIVRESKQYLNGQLTIGGLGGNLLFGVELADVAVDVSGARVVAVKGIELDYSVFQILSKGLVLTDIRLDQPYLLVQRDTNGWNLANLVKKQRKEADREGPSRPISLPSIQISDGRIAIQDHLAGDGYDLPREITDLDVRAGFEYAPVHYSVTLDHVSFRGTSPSLALNQLTGKFAVRDDNLYVENLALRMAETSVTIDGVIEQYLGTPVVKLTTTGNVSLPEIGRIVPAVAGYPLHPAIDLKVSGPARNLALELNVRSEAGNVRGRLMADVQAPNFAARGGLDLEHVNLAPILKDPAQKSDLTGHATLDLKIASAPASAPIADRLNGTFAFDGPRVVAAGYEARNVRVTGSLDGPRITLDGGGAAYGGTATAKGFIVTPAPGRPFAFDLRGAADNVDLRRLPATTGAPNLATDLSVAEYHIQGQRRTSSGTAVLNLSTVEGATIGDGTTAQFNLTPSTITYGARGNVAALNIERLGRRLKVAALAVARYDSRINGALDISGSQPRTPATAGRRASAGAPSALSTMTLDATGDLTDSTVLGGRLPRLGFEVHLDQGALQARADGTFENFNPGQLTGRTDFDGRVSGSINANVAVRDVTAPITPDGVTADGTLALNRSTVGGLQIESANVEGTYASQIGDITRLNVTGPDVKADASGRLALDRSSQSNLKYHVDAVNLEQLAKLAGQTAVQGAATFDGTLTGNAASLTTTGTLNGSNLGYQDNSALDLNSRYTVTVPELTFAHATFDATTDATFVKVGGMELNSVKATTKYADKRMQFTTNIQEKTREIDATGEVLLHPDHQDVHLPQLAIRTQGVEWRIADGSQAKVQYGGNRIDLANIKLISAGQSLDVSGSIATGSTAAEGNATAIDVHARNVDLQQLQTLALMDRGLSGTLNADAKISGSTAAPVVDGRIEINNGGFRTYHYDSLTANLEYRGTRVGIDATLQQSPTEAITVKGTVPTSLFRGTTASGHVPAAGADQVDLHITSTALSLAAIQGITNEVTNVTGTLEADVRVTGSGEDPHLVGYIDIKAGGFGVPAVGETYTGLTTRIDLQPELVKIQRFEILDRHGERLAIDGQLAVHEREAGAVTINVTSDNFELVHNELGDVQVQSALQVTGEVRRPRVVGSVRIDSGRIEVDKIMQLFYDPYATTALPEVVSAERMVEGSGSAEEATKQALASAQRSAAAPGATAAATELPAPTGIMDPLAIDVQIAIPDNLVLRGTDIRPGGPTGTALGSVNITVGGDVRARKDPGGPITFIGTVNTVRGTYEFQGRRFDLQRDGTLRFTGSSQFNPRLDLIATREIPNTGVTARVHLTGTAVVPQLALSSDPPLEESDILALIVFNRPVNELGTGERSSLAATAGGIATGFLAAPLGQSIGKALGLDLFEITTTTEAGGLGAGVTLGQQIGDRAFVKLRQQFGESSSGEFMIEYQLTRFLRLQATAAPETSGSANRVNQRRVERAGIDLIFFFSY